MGRVAYLTLFALIMSSLALRLQIQRSAGESVMNFARKYDQEIVRNIANAGATKGLNALTINVLENVGAANVSLYGGKYSYFFERKVQDPVLTTTQIRVTSIGRYQGLSDTVVVLITRPSFSRYAYFTNYEGNIWFYSGDTLRGPVHTNTYFQMGGSPVFFGKVTSSQVYDAWNPYRPYPWGPTNPVFLDGTEWGIPTIDMPTEIPSETINAAQNGGIYINKKYAWIVFQSDGTVKIASKNTSSEPPPGSYTTYNLSAMNGVIYVHYTSSRPLVKIKGTVNGQATVATRGSMEITDDLVYADNPMTNPNSDDILGLVAAKDIMVADNQIDQDRTIQATVMTLNGTAANDNNFWVEDYDDYRYGTLHLYGGLIQQARGAVGIVGTPITRKGYQKDYRWDTRMAEMSPPHFPLLFALRKLAWWD